MKKIVIKMYVATDKCRKKAFKIAASQGVQSISLEGESSDQVVVTGDGVDAICLINKMRKKFRDATLVSVEDMKGSEEDGDNGGDGGGDGEGEEKNGNPRYGIHFLPYPRCPVYDLYPYPDNGCFIL